MKGILKSLALTSLVFGMGTAQAVPVEISFTADNVTNSGGLCFDMNCSVGTGWSELGSTPNLADWRASDSVTVDLDAGTHWFAWFVSNTERGSPTNPAGLLAEILWDGGANASSSAWEVSWDGGSNWQAATTYGNNGGANIWSSVNGGAVAGISTDASWLWSEYNHNIEMDSSAWIRTSITIAQAPAQVPEPGTLALLGLGLAGIGFSRRRKI